MPSAFTTQVKIRYFYLRTWHVPDETWQSVEVSHLLSFDSGHLTWEWQPGAAIRSFIHPLMFAPFLSLLQLMGADTTEAVVVLPRIIQVDITSLIV